jgi:hypothetical protein
MALAFSDSVMRVGPSIFKARIARSLFLMVLVKFQNDPWPGFNLRTLLLKPLQRSRKRLLSVSNSSLSYVLRLFCHTECKTETIWTNERNRSNSRPQNCLSKVRIIESTSAPDPTLSSEKFKSIRESITRRNKA